MVKRADSFVTSDGRSFDDEVAAHRHERAHRLRHLDNQPIMQDVDDKWIAYSEEIARILHETDKALATSNFRVISRRHEVAL